MIKKAFKIRICVKKKAKEPSTKGLLYFFMRNEEEAL